MPPTDMSPCAVMGPDGPMRHDGSWCDGSDSMCCDTTMNMPPMPPAGSGHDD